MGQLINPGADKFEEALNSEIYVDKSGLIAFTNRVLGTTQKYVCFSRPRRFGKSMAADMLSAYYDRSIDEKAEFSMLKISTDESFEKYLNKFDVVKINMQEYLSESNSMEELLTFLTGDLVDELSQEYPDISFNKSRSVEHNFGKTFANTKTKFIIIIDEWDCIFREYPKHSKEQSDYLDFLRDFLKDKNYIALVYMTGILPIKKYGTNSALNMFMEFSMEDPLDLAEFVGFTDNEVAELCNRYDMDFDECKSWYNGYYFKNCGAVYNPNSIVRSMLYHTYRDFWNRTETYEALRVYIAMNFDGLKDSIIKLMSGERQKINTGTFQNDMTSMSSADDVMTLLIHLGYLGYDIDAKEVFIPNKEILQEFVNATTGKDAWNEVVKSVKESDELLNATWNSDEKEVASYIENAHLETSHIQYNDENALSYTISLAYYSARQYYNIVRELPAGKGFADLVFYPRKKYADKPAMIVELKWDMGADTAIKQIHEKKYPKGLSEYKGNILLVGISYDKKTKKHECRIDKV